MPNLSLWFRGLRGRLLFLTVFPIFLLAGISLVAIDGIDLLIGDIQKAAFVRTPITKHAGDMESAANGMVRYLWTAYAAESVSERKKALEMVEHQLNRFDESHRQYLTFSRSPIMVKLFKPIEEAWPQGKDAVVEAVLRLREDSSASREAAKSIITSRIRPRIDLMTTTLEKMGHERMNLIKQEAEAEIASAVAHEHLAILMAVGGGLISILISLWVSSRTARALADAIQRIGEVGGQVTSASTSLSAASQQASSGATEAASSLEETVASLEELSSMVKLNSEHAREAASLSQTSRQSAEQGETEIRSLITAMSEIAGSSKKIEEIINVIDDIAFQTNLLALNAAVEAARAGEQGKGFAVVAEAVRSLAQRSAAAAKDINSMIKDSVDRIERGTKVADNSGEALRSIVSSVMKVADLNNEIALASQEQSTGISQISTAMNQLDQATQGNASSSQEVAAASEEMSSQAKVLDSLVEELNSMVDGTIHAKTHVVLEDVPVAAVARVRRKPPLEIVPAAGSSSAKPRRAQAEEVIPFEDEAGGKVGNLDGF